MKYLTTAAITIGSFTTVLLTALLIAALAGCATAIGHAPPPTDWPTLKIIEHRVPTAVMRERCLQYVPTWAKILSLGTVEACAEWHFVLNECHVWYSADYPPSQFIVAHELAHCEGRDHPGETTARDAWERFKGTK